MTEPAQPTAEEKARYDSLKNELIHAIPKKRALDKHLAMIEAQIYNLEGTYLTETSTSTGGNIITGFDGYLKQSGAARRKYELSDHDRLFSASSLTSQKSLELLENEDDGSGTMLPRRAESDLTSHQKKLKRDAEYQRKKRAQAAQARGRSTTVDSEDEPSISSRRPHKRQKMDED